VVAAVPYGIGLLQALRSERPDVLAKTVVTPWPAGPGGQPAVGADGVLLVVNGRGPHAERASHVVRRLLSKEHYPGLLAAAVPAIFSPLRGYDGLDVFTKDAWSRQFQQAVVPHAVALTADGPRTPVFDALTPIIDAELRRAVTGGIPAVQVIASLDQRAKEEAKKVAK
jgi:ABC-type glycerol-3-phosphate transport system substrate-binding protein